MEVISEEHLGTATGFRYWSGDLHRPEVVLRAGRRRFSAVLEERRADGTLVLSVEDLRRLDDLVDDAGGEGGARLGLAFRADEVRFARQKAAPLFTTDYAVDRSARVIEARFALDQAVGGQHLLPEPIAASVRSGTLFRRPRRVSVTRLSPYHGEFVADDSGRCLSPGMVVVIDLWLPWSGELRLHAQVTACQDAFGGGRFAFRIVNEGSVKRAAVVLAGTVEGFGFAALKAVGVPPGQVTKYLTVRTVSDPTAFQQALRVRLAGNRDFGRLAGVRDGSVVADHLDAHSVTFVCCLGDKPLGTGRLVVNGGDRALSEIETQTQGLPEKVWAGGFVEVSRLAIHPDYRGAGVIVALFREVARLAFNLDCRYLILDAIGKLVPIYERIGAKRLPIVKTHPYSKETVRVLAIDIGKQLSRIDRRLISWQYVFGPVLKHHMRTSSPRSLSRLVRGLGNIPFWIKRLLSRVA
ncbi:GNAT family N-acetyltransferase [Streptomyces sp. ISL-100]|uniref:GNAT family N-acetyltransferase n=1 Tax=Streptomyces sp. ISL-100 TaxID=2819173 RepID=UPI001BE4F280|nr:GNAT family N-acetyltransferase [Streptomyces sp. ISL-100]MBT2401568.1 GNAT family N-acetyltransferase [Streptomyces sp. ISL-100]